MIKVRHGHDISFLDQAVHPSAVDCLLCHAYLTAWRSGGLVPTGHYKMHSGMRELDGSSFS